MIGRPRIDRRDVLGVGPGKPTSDGKKESKAGPVLEALGGGNTALVVAPAKVDASKEVLLAFAAARCQRPADA